MKTGITYALAPVSTPAFRLPSLQEWQSMNVSDQDFMANVVLAVKPTQMSKARSWAEENFPEPSVRSYAIYHNLRHYEENVNSGREVLNEINSMF